MIKTKRPKSGCQDHQLDSPQEHLGKGSTLQPNQSTREELPILLNNLITDPKHDLYSLLNEILERHLQSRNLVFKSLHGLDMSLDLPMTRLLVLLCTTSHLNSKVEGILIPLLILLKRNLQLIYPRSHSRRGAIGILLLLEGFYKLKFILQIQPDPCGK